jgi:hypothetical protein
MKDDQLIMAVKESVTGVHMHVPTEEIVRRGRAVRARRRIPGFAAALAGSAAATVLALTVLVPAGHHPARPPSAQLAAWTVVKRADGTVSVTIRELRDPAGLQRRLRADGIPASVTFFGQMPRWCRRYPAEGALIDRVFTLGHAGRFPVMVIHPAALPGGAGVAISPPIQQPITAVPMGLVYASPQCTGN